MDLIFVHNNYYINNVRKYTDFKQQMKFLQHCVFVRVPAQQLPRVSEEGLLVCHNTKLYR